MDEAKELSGSQAGSRKEIDVAAVAAILPTLYLSISIWPITGDC
jgi:hypothetical protein